MATAPRATTGSSVHHARPMTVKTTMPTDCSISAVAKCHGRCVTLLQFCPIDAHDRTSRTVIPATPSAHCSANAGRLTRATRHATEITSADSPKPNRTARGQLRAAGVVGFIGIKPDDARLQPTESRDLAHRNKREHRRVKPETIRRQQSREQQYREQACDGREQVGDGVWGNADDRVSFST
jgi:hypothetical protein